MRMLNRVGETWIVGCSWSRYEYVLSRVWKRVVGCSWSRYEYVKQGVETWGCWL